MSSFGSFGSSRYLQSKRRHSRLDRRSRRVKVFPQIDERRLPPLCVEASKVSAPLITEQGYLISVFKPGSHNKQGGPDFEFAELILNDLRWVGAVEIHLRSSDWYRHGHNNDPAYDAVILHVVREDDVEVCRNDGTLMHTMTLKKVVPTALVDRYQFTFKRAIEFIPCEHEIKQVEATHWVLWKERLYIERLEERSNASISFYKSQTKLGSCALCFISS